ncbi:nucleoside diphosphate kinase regulator [Labrys okinawensis]|uniref:Nucleoside diphosphate kinase regulator n=1 Tax=Labrys okinawensis TaxID=346911 RepID=A0A2S9Q5P1_9HYPH|nr:nucleoside diphosphate kinase regulator [Labrys okinawensis]PRH84655.1 nucleoside diphosphate kinase regulator [Labrys okinawensis]
MNHPLKNQARPSIIVNDVDFERLTQLATSALDRFPEVAEALLGELDRAEIVPATEVGHSVVQIGSVVTFETEGGAMREVRLVYPGEADIAEGKVSILTPIGTALLGLSPGQSITWKARDGREHELHVTAVKAP